MCGIFGYMLSKPVPLDMVFKVLERLEVHKYSQEPNPLGGYGAGLAVLLDDGTVISQKIGSIDSSPARHLSKTWDSKVSEASILISHVRMPSPEFTKTANHKETAQPYVVEFEPDLTVASVHNGKVHNYEHLRKSLGSRHVFESEKVQLVDSEVIPHYFQELLTDTGDVDEALYRLSCTLEGPSAIGMLQMNEENTFLHLIHKGKTRGLIVWTNNRNEVLFCSRKEPLTEEFRRILARGKFKEKASIRWREDAGLKLSFSKTAIKA